MLLRCTCSPSSSIGLICGPPRCPNRCAPRRSASERRWPTLLENLSDRVQGKPERPWPDLEAELAQMEKTFAVEIKNVTDANVVAHLHGRFALYKEIVPVVGRLTRLRAG